MTNQENSVELNEGIIEIVERGPQTKESIKWILNEMTKLSQGLDDTLLLVDVTEVTKADLGARLEAKKIAGKEDYDKMAFVGASIFIKTLINLIVKATQSADRKVRFFDKREDALAWLKSE